MSLYDVDITIIDKKTFFSINSKEKKPKSGITLGFIDTATSPLKPINKTIGIIIRNEINKLFFKEIKLILIHVST